MSKRLYLAQYTGFASLGITTCIVGPLLPAIRSDIHISLGQAGLLLSAQFLGSMLTVFIGGYLADLLGKKIFLIFGSLLLFCGLSGSMLAYGFNSLFCFNLLTGVGSGTYNIGINSLCADSNDVNKGKAMNFLHFFYGLGAIAGPIIVTMCIKVFGHWRSAFGIAAIMPVIVAVILFPLSVKAGTVREPKGNKGNLPYRNLFLWFVGISAFFYVGVETSIYGWSSTFWSGLSPNDVIPASLLATIFWMALTFGRLTCGKITDRAGFSRYITSASLITMLLILIWFLFPNRSVTLFVTLATGLTLAGIFPTLVASVTSVYPGDSGKVTAFIYVFASLAGFLVPSVIGRMADYFQIAVLPLVILLMSVMLVIFTYVTWNIIFKHKLKTDKENVK